MCYLPLEDVSRDGVYLSLSYSPTDNVNSATAWGGLHPLSAGDAHGVQTVKGGVPKIYGTGGVLFCAGHGGGTP